MAQGSRNIELNIIKASDVRRYAKDVLLAQPLRENVEQVLLDDDRARALVMESSEPPRQKGPHRLAKNLRRAYETGSEAVNAYYAAVRQKNVGMTTKLLTGRRIILRKEMLRKVGEMRSRAMPEKQEQGDLTLSGVCSDFQAGDHVTDKAEMLDGQFLRALKACFAAPSHPYYKAKIADIVAALENEHAHINWGSGEP